MNAKTEITLEQVIDICGHDRERVLAVAQFLKIGDDYTTTARAVTAVLNWAEISDPLPVLKTINEILDKGHAIRQEERAR